MKDSYERLLDLRSQLSKFDEFLPSFINEEIESADFAHKFASQMNYRALEKRRSEFTSLLAGNHKEIFEIVLTGETIGIGTASASSVGSFLDNLQNLFTRTMQSIIYGARDCGPVPNSIKETSNLQIEAVAPGSFKILFSGDIPGADMFDKDLAALNENPFSKTTQLIFDIMEEKDTDTILENIIPLGKCVTSSFKDLARSLAENKINLSSSWNSLSGKRRIWEKDYSFMNNLIIALDQVEDPEVTPVQIKGSFIDIHSEKNKFEFRAVDNSMIKGIFSEELKPVLLNIGVNPLASQTFTADFIQEKYKYSKDNRIKSIWILKNVQNT